MLVKQGELTSSWFFGTSGTTFGRTRGETSDLKVEARDRKGKRGDTHARILRLVSSNDGQEVVPLEEVASSFVAAVSNQKGKASARREGNKEAENVRRRDSREEIRASSDVVVDEALVRCLVSKVFQRVGPEKIAHDSVGGRLSESIDLGKTMERKDVSAELYERQKVGYSPLEDHPECGDQATDLRGYKGIVYS